MRSPNAKNLFSTKAKAGFWYIALAVYALQAESKRRYLYYYFKLNYQQLFTKYYLDLNSLKYFEKIVWNRIVFL